MNSQNAAAKQPAVPPIAIDRVSKAFDGQQILREVSLDVQPGEIFGLVGLNGVGKTTLIKILLGLREKDSGEALIFGRPAAVKTVRKQLVYLPEKFQPSMFLKGREFLSLALAYYHMKLDLDRARTLAEALDLDPKALDRRVSGYSKGMGQKLGLLSVLLSDRPLMILDEPMSGLDPMARIRLKDQLLKCREQGRTLLISSHILADMDEICDRIGVLHQGGLAFLGTPAALREQQGETSLERAFIRVIGAK